MTLSESAFQEAYRVREQGLEEVVDTVVASVLIALVTEFQAREKRSAYNGHGGLAAGFGQAATYCEEQRP
jgi:hypothetical protein